MSPRPQRQAAGERPKRAAAEQWQVISEGFLLRGRRLSLPSSLRRGLLTRVPPFPQDFKGFWESRFGGRKEREPEQNGSANGEANGSAPKRTADLAVYEQFEQQVRTASRGLFAILSGVPNACGCCSLVLVR